MRKFLLLIIILSNLASANLFSQNKENPAIDFTIYSTEGQEVNLFAELENGKTVLLSFFYTDCGNCVLEAPTVDSIYKRFGSGEEQLLVWGIAHPLSNLTEIQEFIEETEITYPVFPIGLGSEVFSDYNVLYTPQIFIVCNYVVSNSVSSHAIVETLDYCFPTRINKVTIYPEIYSRGTNIYVTNSFNEPATAGVYDITGRLINKISMNPKEEIVIRNLKSGNMYIVNIISQSGKKHTQKLIIR